jgi:hypothetical protein
MGLNLVVAIISFLPAGVPSLSAEDQFRGLHPSLSGKPSVRHIDEAPVIAVTDVTSLLANMGRHDIVTIVTARM